MRPIPPHAHDALGRIAHEHFIPRRNRDARVERAKTRHLLDLPRRVYPINLPRLPACPDETITVESKAFWVIQAVGEDLETLDGQQRGGHGGVCSLPRDRASVDEVVQCPLFREARVMG